LASPRRQIERLQRTGPGYNAANQAAAWQTATHVNGFANTGSGYAPVAYYKDTFGRVFLRGAVTRPNTTQPLTIFTLDAGYEPLFQHEFAAPASLGAILGTAIIGIGPGGTVDLVGSGQGAGARIMLDGVSFRSL
jgi:hypothetical protein